MHDVNPASRNEQTSKCTRPGREFGIATGTLIWGKHVDPIFRTLAFTHQTRPLASAQHVDIFLLGVGVELSPNSTVSQYQRNWCEKIGAGLFLSAPSADGDQMITSSATTARPCRLLLVRPLSNKVTNRTYPHSPRAGPRAGHRECPKGFKDVRIKGLGREITDAYAILKDRYSMLAHPQKPGPG